MPSDLVKTIPKPYLTVTLGLFYHISAIYVADFAYISPTYYPYIIKIKATFPSFEFVKNLNMYENFLIPPKFNVA